MPAPAGSSSVRPRHYPQISLKQAVDALERLDLNEAEKDKIRYGNARRV